MFEPNGTVCVIPGDLSFKDSKLFPFNRYLIKDNQGELAEYKYFHLKF